MTNWLTDSSGHSNTTEWSSLFATYCFRNGTVGFQMDLGYEKTCSIQIIEEVWTTGPGSTNCSLGLTLDKSETMWAKKIVSAIVNCRLIWNSRQRTGRWVHRKVSLRLCEQILSVERENDICRYGGDEPKFLLVFYGGSIFVSCIIHT